MAGRARTNAVLDALDQRRIAHFEIDPLEPSDETILDYVAEWLANGHTLKALAQELTDDLSFEVWAETLNRILRRQFTEERVERVMRESRARASHSWAEESVALVDQADATSKAGVSKAAAQARSRQWLAEKFNPSEFGQRTNTNIAISVTALHLDALRAVPTQVTVSHAEPVAVVALPAATADTADAK